MRDRHDPERGRGAGELSLALGKIRFISSVHESIPWARRVNHAASKGGVMRMMKTLAQEFVPLRVRVNTIASGVIQTRRGSGTRRDQAASLTVAE